MAQPTTYTRQYDFTDYQTANPSEPLPGDQVDAELNAVKTTLDGVLANLALVQADDGQLAGAIVDLDALDSDVVSLLSGLVDEVTIRGAWATTTVYAVGDIVKQGSPARTWLCLEAHTSGTFSTDETAGKWTPMTAAKGDTGATGATGDTGATGPAGSDGAISALSSQAQAITGTDNTTGMTPLRVRNALDNRIPLFTGPFALSNGKLKIEVDTPTSGDMTISVVTLADATPSSATPVLIRIPDGTGGYNVRTLTAACTVVVSNGSELGFSNASALWIGAMDNAGTVELFVHNARAPNVIAAPSEDGTVSTTAEGGAGAADSAGVSYSTTARTTLNFVWLARAAWESGLATPGDWDTAPRTVLVGPGMKRPGETVKRIFVAKTDTQVAGNIGAAGTWVSITNLAATFTMSSAANYVAGRTVVNVSNSGANTTKAVRVLRSAVAVAPVGTTAGSRTVVGALQGNDNAAYSIAYDFFEAPNSAAALTYQVQVTLNTNDDFTINVGIQTDGDAAATFRAASILVIEEIQA